MKQRISIFTTCSDDYWDLTRIGAMSKAEYAIRHGYQLILVKNEGSMVLTQERVLQILGHIRDCNYLFFMGADTVITNMNVKIEDIIAKYPDKDIVVGRDINGMNNDVMLIRNSLTSVVYFSNVLNNFKNFYTDQNAMTFIYPEIPGLNYIEVPQREFNSMPYWLYPYGEYPEGTWQKGDFVFHCPGLDMETRKKVMLEIKEQIVR